MARIGGVWPGRTKEVFQPTPAALHERAREAFPEVQRAWNDRDVDVLSRLTTEGYVERARPVIDALDRKLHINRIEDADLYEVAVAQPGKADSAERMDAYLAFVVRDWLEDLRTGEVIGGDPESLLAFVERWSFVFDDGRGWALDRVSTVWEGSSPDVPVKLRGMPAGRYSRAEAPARWVEWDGSAWAG